MLSYESDNIFSSSLSSSFPLFAMISIIPLLILMSPSPIQALASSNQFTVYRMQQFDMPNSHYGCRASLMNLEACTIHRVRQSFVRKCLILKLHELLHNFETVQNIIEDTLVAGILILFSNSFNTMNNNQKKLFLEFEKLMLGREIQIPVYFAFESPELLEIYETEKIKSINDLEDNPNETVSQKILNPLFANNHQLVVSEPQISIVKDVIITNIQGKLTGSGSEDQLPTIAIVAHYDAFGLAPGLSYGFDSNGSGVAVLLELARLFSKLYANPKTHPKINLLFLLSGAGKYNYIGTKKWIDENLDSSENSILLDSLFTICLDSLAGTVDSDRVYVHVSKPPRDGTPAAQFYQDLKDIAAESDLNVSMVHKKINLADDMLAWEHERFSIRRLPGMTVSTVNNSKSLLRKSILDVFHPDYVRLVSRHTHILAHSIARQIYDVKDLDIFNSDLQVSQTFLHSLLYQITNHSRAQQFLLSKQKGSHIELLSTLVSLEHILTKFVKDVKLFHYKLDKTEPEVVFYEPLNPVMNVFNVKHAMFDFIISLGIGCYLALFYLLLSNFNFISYFIRKIKTQNEEDMKKQI